MKQVGPVTALVIGANGYLGSHVTRQLVADGRDVRVMVRAQRRRPRRHRRPGCARGSIGDIWDDDVLREAMTGVDVVYYLRGGHPRLVARSVAAVPHQRRRHRGTCSLEVARSTPDCSAFVFTSSYATVGCQRGQVATEEDVIADRRASTPYVRVAGAGREPGVGSTPANAGCSAVAMCVSTTYGSGDWGRTPHGAIIAGARVREAAVRDERDLSSRPSASNDAARALILAAEQGPRGRAVPISEKMISNAEVACASRRRRPVCRRRPVHSAAADLPAGGAGQHQGPAARAPTNGCRWPRCG